MVRGARVKRRRTKTPVILAFIGVSGAGASTLAKAFSKILGWSVVEKNKIRVKLREEGKGFTPQKTDQIHYAMLAKVLKSGGNAICDSDFVEKPKRKKLERFAKKFGARVLYLRLFCDRDVMFSRMLKSKYDPKKDIFKSAAVAVREHSRRLLWHYRWSEANGGSFKPKKLPIKFFAEINTADSKAWQKKVRLLAKRLKRF